MSGLYAGMALGEQVDILLICGGGDMDFTCLEVSELSIQYFCFFC